MPTWEEILSDRKTYPDESSVRLADGTEVQLKDLRPGYMKDADYRRKTAEVARQREEAELAARDVAYRQQAIQEAEANLRAVAQQLVAANPGVTRAEVNEDPTIVALRSELTEMKKGMGLFVQGLKALHERQQAATMETAAEQHRRVLARLKADHPDLDENDLVEYAKGNYVPRLDIAFRAKDYDSAVERARKEGREAGLKEGIEKGKLEALAPPSIPQRRSIVADPEAPKTMDEAAAAAARDPEILNLLRGGV